MDAARLIEQLMARESPFSWGIPEILDKSSDKFIDFEIVKFNNAEEENDFKWSRYILGLLLSYELCEKRKDYNEALEYIKWCKDHLQSLKRSRCQELLFTKLYTTLLYVSSISEAIILIKYNKIDQAEKVIQQWPFSLSASASSEYSNLLGIKAALYIYYGTEGQRLALTTAEKAKDLDPHQAEWWFLIGNALGRLRRVENGPITEREIVAIEKAFALEKNATYIVHLAQLYSEYANVLYFINKMYAQGALYADSAVKRYREAINLRPNCTLLKARVAHGMLRIRCKKLVDVPFAKKLLDEVARSTPTNAMVFHDLGYYYEKFENNTEKAIECLKKSNDLGNIKALIYMINIKWKHGKEDEIIEDITESMRTKYSSTEAQAQLLSYLGVCQVLTKDDWESAIQSFHKSLLVDSSANYLENFQGFDNNRVDLLSLVTNYLHWSGDNKTQLCPGTVKSFLTCVLKIKLNIIVPDSTKKYTFNDWKNDQLKVNSKNNNHHKMKGATARKNEKWTRK